MNHRELCPHLLVEEEERGTLDPNNPFNPVPRCQHLKNLRKLDPELDKSFGNIDSCCIAVTVPDEDHNQWPHWCPPVFDHPSINLSAYHHYKEEYPQLKKIRHCSICGNPIIFGGVFSGGTCRKCWIDTKFVHDQPAYLLGGSNTSKQGINRAYWR